jgi:D-alanine-D-alanine ligase
VKPKNEAVSFGLKVVHDEEQLRQAAGAIFQQYRQPVLAERYIEGREVNVGLLGNNPPDAFPPVELIFGGEGPPIYTYEDKTGRSKRTIGHECPAPIGPELQENWQRRLSPLSGAMTAPAWTCASTATATCTSWR